MSQNQAQYLQNARTHKRRVFFTGSTALKRGQGVCYDADRGTATAVDGSRDRYVELPSAGNNQFFAGTCVDDYPAKTGGQEIHVFEPGGYGLVALNVASTVASTYVSCLAGGGNAGAGRFIGGSMRGRGAALVEQTFTTITDADDVTPGHLTSSLDGTATWTASSRTLTKTAAFTYAAVGDKVYIVAGVTTSGSTSVITVGEYTISSVTSANAVVLATSAGSTDSSVSFYATRGNPVALAYLCDGDPSGMSEWITPYTDESGTTDVTSMYGGTTHIFGGITLGTGDAVHNPFANGTYVGQRKRWKLNGALTTNDYLVTLATTGEQLDGTTDLSSLEFDGAGDESVIEWTGAYYRLVHNKGTGLA